MKVKGEELIAFIEAAWPQPSPHWYWDHDLFIEPSPNETYDTNEIGPVFYQGDGEDPTGGDGYDLAALIRQWRKVRDFDIITLEIPKARIDEIRTALTSLGIKFKF